MAQGQEIERARALLAAVTRARVLSAEAAAKAYEVWAAETVPRPFSRYMIDEQLLPADQVRAHLRTLAVQGLPHPELFTNERFEDLLIGQLGIESQVLSPKLLQTVRAVQDKKAKEGKLRRLAELLPRAGFDPKLLAMLEQHLKERALICRGCLARYPRRGIDLNAIVCPRCGQTIDAPALDLQASMAASAEMERLPEETRRALQESAERVIQTVTVGTRMRRKGDPSKAIMFSLLAALLVVGGVIVVLSSQKPPPSDPRPTRPPTPNQTPTTPAQPDPGPSQPAPPGKTPEGGAARGLAATREREQALLAQGRWEEARQAWQAATPAAGEDAAAFEQARKQRLGELEQLTKLASAVREELAGAQSAREDQALESRLAGLLGQAAGQGAREEDAPFRDAVQELEQRRAERRTRAREAAANRLRELEAHSVGREGAWEVRRQRVQAKPPVLHSLALPDALRDAQLTDLDRDGFSLQRKDGQAVRLAWSDDPVVSLEVAREVARDSASPDDRLELLLRALLACDPLVAREAADKLGVDPGLFDPREVIRQSPTAGPVMRLDDQRYRLRWPTGWTAHDLKAGSATKLTPGPRGLKVEGDPAELRGAPIPVSGGRPKLALQTELDPSGGGEASLSLELLSEGAARTYRVRWNATTWTLELDVGGGANLVRGGSLATMARRARLELAQGRTAYRLSVQLDGVDQVETNVPTSFESVRVGLGATSPVTLLELTLEGELDRKWVEEGRAAYQAGVERRLAGLPTLSDQDAGLRPLSVEDALGLRELSEADRGRLREARQAIQADKSEELARLLSTLPPDVPAVAWCRAYLACWRDDPGLADRLLRPVLERDQQFAEARALRALALSRLGRFDASVEAARTALDNQPDLPLALLALARAGQLGRDLGAPPGEAAPEVLGLPLRLAPRDPLVRQEVTALREAAAIERTFPRRVITDQHAVLFEDQGFTAAAKELGTRLDQTCNKLLAPLRQAKLPGLRTAPVAILPGGEYDAQAPTGTHAAWLPRLGLLLLRGSVPSELGWDKGLAVAECWSDRLAPGIPAWAWEGLSAYCLESTLGQPPPGWVERLRGEGAWTAQQWQRLFEQDRTGLRADPSARAHAWALVRLVEWRPPLKRDLIKAIEQAANGQPQDWSAFTGLDLVGSATELDQALDKRPGR